MLPWLWGNSVPQKTAQWRTWKKFREESQAFPGSKYFYIWETDCLASGLSCLKWRAILIAELKLGVSPCWCLPVAVKMVKPVQVKSVQIYQNTHGQKQRASLWVSNVFYFTQWSRTSNRLALQASELLLSMHFSQSEQKNPNKPMVIPASASLQQSNQTCH